MIIYNNFSKITKFLLNKIHMIKFKYKNILKNRLKIILIKRQNQNLQLLNKKDHNRFRWSRMIKCQSSKLPSKLLLKNLIRCNQMTLNIMINIQAVTLDVGLRVKHQLKLQYRVFRNRIKKSKSIKLLTKTENLQ